MKRLYMKKFITLLIFINFLASGTSYGIFALEFQLREIRDKYRHYPIEGGKKIENLWKDYPDLTDRLNIFLDLKGYYRNNSLNELLISQGKWLLDQDISSEQKKMWIINLVADTLSASNKIDEAIKYYELEFRTGCITRGKKPETLSRNNFLKYGIREASIWGDWAINAAITYANAKKFSDSYAILKYAKVLTIADGIKAGRTDVTYRYQKTRIKIMGLMEGKMDQAVKELKLINNGKPYLDHIEPGNNLTWEEELCLKSKNYGFLISLYLNTLVENPPVRLFTYRQIIYNSRDNVYILSKILEHFPNPDFSKTFEKILKQRIKNNNMPHLNLLLAEYYFYMKNFKQAFIYYQKIINNPKSKKYFWPRYYPKLDLNNNYKFPHRPHLWTTCLEKANKQLENISKEEN